MFFWSSLRNGRTQSRFARPKVTKRPENETVPGLIKVGRVDKACLMRELTATGVILEFVKDAPPDMPQFFYLKSQSERVFRRGRLIWQHRRQVGVEFISNWASST